MAKEYTIIKSYRGRDTEVKGTIAELVSYFSYTFEIGYSWNRKINKNPKTIKAFIKNLRLSLEEKEGSCYERTHIELVN